MDKIRILIADDDNVWCNSLSSFLSQHEELEIIGTATSKVEAIKRAKQLNADVLLLDMNLSESLRDGIHTALALQGLEGCKIIMLTSSMDKEVIRDSFAAGAVDYIFKEDYKLLPCVIKKAYHGSAPMQAILEDYVRLKREDILKPLTTAERAIYELMEKGYSQIQIEQELYKTQNTLRTQIKNILKKLGVSSSKDAVKKVRTKGILDSEELKKLK